MFVESFLNCIGSSCDFKGASASLLILRILILVNTLIARSTVRVWLGLTSYYLSDKIVFNAWLQVIGNTSRPASFRLQLTHSPTGAWNFNTENKLRSCHVEWLLWLLSPQSQPHNTKLCAYSQVYLHLGGGGIGSPGGRGLGGLRGGRPLGEGLPAPSYRTRKKSVRTSRTSGRRGPPTPPCRSLRMGTSRATRRR